MNEDQEFKAVLLDLDGTVYLGEKVLPGAVELVQALRKKGIKTLFISNKPFYSRQVYADKLTSLGIPTPAEQVLTSAYVLAKYLSNHFAGLTYYVVGEESLKNELRQYGLKIFADLEDQEAGDVIDPSGIDAVIVAFDRTLNYRKLNTAFQALHNGAKFFATNSDKVCPMPNGVLPDAGPTIAYLEYITGKKVELLAGKPSPIILQVALDILKVKPQQCIMVGDRLETDIRMGNQFGLRTALVLSGITQMEMLADSPDQPDEVFENLLAFGKKLGMI